MGTKMNHDYASVCNMVEELMDNDGDLSSWEWDFVNDMGNKVVAGESFSEKQIEKIVKIWEEKC